MDKLTSSKLLTLRVSVPGAFKSIPVSALNSELVEKGFSKSIRVSKEVIKTKDLSELNKIVQSTKQALSRIAIPWPGHASLYVIPEGVYDRVIELLREMRVEFNEATEAFVERYSEIKEEAKARLGELYLESDYLSEEELRKKFGFQYFITQIVLPKEQEQELRENMISDWKSIQSLMAASLREGFLELLGKLRNACDTNKDRKTPLRSVTWARLMQFIELFDERNIGEDVELSKIINDFREIVNGVDYEEFKDDEFRQEIFNATARIAEEAERLTSGVRVIGNIGDTDSNEESSEDSLPIDTTVPSNNVNNYLPDEDEDDEYEEYEDEDDEDDYEEDEDDYEEDEEEGVPPLADPMYRSDN